MKLRKTRLRVLVYLENRRCRLRVAMHAIESARRRGTCVRIKTVRFPDTGIRQAGRFGLGHAPASTYSSVVLNSFTVTPPLATSGPSSVITQQVCPPRDSPIPARPAVGRRRSWIWQERRPSTRPRPYCTIPRVLPAWPSTTTGLSIIFSRISFTSFFIEFSVINSVHHTEI